MISAHAAGATAGAKRRIGQCWSAAALSLLFCCLLIQLLCISRASRGRAGQAVMAIKELFVLSACCLYEIRVRRLLLDNPKFPPPLQTFWMNEQKPPSHYLQQRRRVRPVVRGEWNLRQWINQIVYYYYNVFISILKEDSISYFQALLLGIIMRAFPFKETMARAQFWTTPFTLYQMEYDGTLIVKLFYWLLT